MHCFGIAGLDRAPRDATTEDIGGFDEVSQNAIQIDARVFEPLAYYFTLDRASVRMPIVKLNDVVGR